MSYLLLKHLHIACVVLSGVGFLLRAYWMMIASPLMQQRMTRVLPHIVDSLLLVSAVSMAWMSGQYPLVQPWLTAKLLALLAYIVFGMVALRRGKTRQVRSIFVVLSVLTYGYIVTVALHRQAWPF